MLTKTVCTSQVLLIMVLMPPLGVLGELRIEGIRHECYGKQGDINLGYITKIRDRGDGIRSFCDETIYHISRLQFVEAAYFAMKKVNADPNILPNITLGVVTFDECSWDLSSLSKALYFLPVDKYPEGTNYTNCSGGLRPFKVAAVLDPASSRSSVAVASVLGVAGIPVLSTFATSDELSDNNRFPYFARLVPPDRFQTQAMLALLERYQWSYVSFLHDEGSYGENAAKYITDGAKEIGVCFAIVRKVSPKYGNSEWDEVVRDLVAESKAKVVLLFMSSARLRLLFAAVERNKQAGHFVWITSDSFAYYEYGPAADMAFSLEHTLGQSPEFAEYYSGLTPDNNPENPWMPLLWENLYDCQWDPAVNNSCYAESGRPDRSQRLSRYINKAIDGVMVYALAIDKLIRRECPGAFENKSLLESCVTGPKTYDYMLTLVYQGITGNISFNAKGDMLGQFVLRQYKWDRPKSEKIKEVGLFNMATLQWTIDGAQVHWPTDDVIKSGNQSRDHIPESVCSVPCPVRHYIFRLDNPCCTECRTCRLNERLDVNETGCTTCADTWWPDDETGTECVPIEPTYNLWSDSIPLVILVINSVATLVAVAIIIVFILNRQHKLVKASSIELSMVIFLGILLAYVTVYVMIARPTQATCTATRLGFMTSSVLIYAPLLVKTIRVYRIFSAGKKGTKKLTGISTKSLMTVTVVVVIVQISLTVATLVIFGGEASLRMPIKTERYAELYCNLPLPGLLIPLSLNLAVILVSAVYGFLTRKLPANFNESWYIFVTVSTTVFLWMVFLPTYFTTFYAIHKAALLACCQLINASINMVCLYLPKVYAVYFVDEEKMQLAQTTNTAGVATSNQVAPAPTGQ